ncbi:methylated-DNA--[protein]-cysteine S-methyltransferase [Frondihabitans sp. Leaf304]|uniref:methylated-DNA--[protein]-cysteine S-methyltransferase n=1 Tax=Frondihabitans sp. Leaf304 TaxID=1736329 RepID=UPI0009FCDF0E|nr:methylated-DNA--[protein]-cysteine S-methyltransferase [Frondihabitans sp. Leaf304]
MQKTRLFPTSFVRYDSPVGAFGIHTRSGSIIRVDIARGGVLPGEGLDECPTALHDEARRQFDDYFAGKRDRFDLPLLQIGTPFQDEVWGALLRVACGETISYGELGHRVGRENGARAVGGAISANRIAILIPCHRVVGSDGRITGYTPGEGIETKRWLLRHEQEAFA